MSAGDAARVIRSRDNPRVVELRKLCRDPAAYRRGRGLWLEGEHLCAAWRDRHGPARRVVLRASSAGEPRLRALAAGAEERLEFADPLFDEISTLESPAAIGYWVDAPPPGRLRPGHATVVFDRLQDAGNAGTLLRTAAGLGFRQVVAMAGTVALWSPKVLRAGMGAHFSLELVEGADGPVLDGLALPLVAAVPRAATALWDAALPWPCAWVLGHEGRGIEPALLASCAVQVAIPQPGGQESLNVAAAGAICLYETVRQQCVAAPERRGQ